MYHFVADQPPEPLILSAANKTQVAGHICQYLKSFQIEAIRFLHTHLAKRELCVLNDEAGLGKTASVAVCLAAMSTPAASHSNAAIGRGNRFAAKCRKCLIVVQNDDDLVAAWQFHFSVLTSASVTVISGAKDTTESTHNVYIAKWGTLRSLSDLSKFNFDFVVLDNRGQMLNNTFCTAMLLKNYEKKVNIVISSIDITSDVKLLHNILRLGGRLEQQYESFKVFEQKFKLPDSREVFSNKNTVDLEEYFQKREVLNFYCKKFRMRRYRHQYEQMLPLVDADRYRINLELWRTANLHSNSNSDRTVETLVSSENSTENLFERFYSIKRRQELSKPKPLELTPLSTPSTPSVIISGGGGGDGGADRGDEQNVNNKQDFLDNCNTPVVMSPLLFVSDSESESNDAEKDSAAAPAPNDSKYEGACEIFDLTSESIKIVLSDEVSEQPATKEASQKVPKKPTKEPKAETSSVLSEKRNLRSRRKSVETQRPKRKQEKPQNISELKDKRESLKQLQKPQKSQVKSATSADLQNTKRTLRTTAANISNNNNNNSNNKTETKKTTAKPPEGTKPQLEEKDKLVSSAKKNNDPVLNEPKSTKAATAPAAAAAKSKRDKPRLNVTSNFGAHSGTHGKMTRSMQRLTRSTDASLKKNKYMLTTLALNIDKKPGGNVGACGGIKKRKQLLQQKRDAETKENKVNKTTTTAKPTSSKQANKPNSRAEIKLLKPKQKRPLQSAAAKTKQVTPPKITKAARKFSQISVLSTSDYEDMQCGQKLTLESSSETSAVRMLEKLPSALPLLSSDNDFLMPPTPYATRNSQNTLPSLFIESEVIFVPSTTAANKDVIVVTSSQDEGSLSSSTQSQSRRTRALKQKRSMTFAATQRSTTTTQRQPTFGELLAKQQASTAPTQAPRSTSPDLFSNCSDLAGLECTQLENRNSGASNNSSNNITPFDGFKIFGSEVKQFQQKHAAAAAAAAASSATSKTTRDRSCLDILEKMFEPRQKQQQQQQQNATTSAKNVNISPIKNLRRAKTPILPAHPIVAIANTQKEAEEAAAAAAKQRSQRKRPLLEEDIFEISNNGTFGCVMRLNSNGEISPVAQQKQSQHNKITNYYIGSGTTQPGGGAGGAAPTNTEITSEEQPAGTPSKNRIKEHLSCASARKSSPKSAKSQQSTKLTRWFLKNSNASGTAAAANARSNSNDNSHTEEEIDEAPATTNVKTEQNKQNVLQTKKQTRNSPTKRRRRRLELSFKN